MATATSVERRPLFIFGAAATGRATLAWLRALGVDDVVGFIDSYKTGHVDGLPIMSFDDFRRDTSGRASVIMGISDPSALFRLSGQLSAERLGPVHPSAWHFLMAESPARTDHIAGRLEASVAGYRKLLDVGEASPREARSICHDLAASLYGLGDIREASRIVARAVIGDPQWTNWSRIGYEGMRQRRGQELAEAYISWLGTGRREALASSMASDVASLRRGPYMESPHTVILETVARCNAHCVFCPYDDLARKGTAMSDAMIDRLVGELALLPRDVPFYLAPYGVNEPMLDTRLFQMLSAVNRRAPNATITLVTNGTALTAANISKLTRLQHLVLNISLHEYRKPEYEKITALSFDKVTSNLDALHQRCAAGEVQFPVSVSRAGDGTVHDFLFCDWLRERYPLFAVGLAEQADWIGQVDVNVPAVPKVGCTHWFELVVRADGTVPLCCADGKGEYLIGDVHKQSLLDIYNSPGFRGLRASAVSRLEREPCSRCTKVE